MEEFLIDSIYLRMLQEIILYPEKLSVGVWGHLPGQYVNHPIRFFQIVINIYSWLDIFICLHTNSPLTSLLFSWFWFRKRPASLTNQCGEIVVVIHVGYIEIVLCTLVRRLKVNSSQQ